MDQTDTIPYSVLGFDNGKYLQIQKDHILDRIDKFREGKLYLEIGGKFMYDAHAARVLPGFDPEVKLQIFNSMKNLIEIMFCVNANDIRFNRQLKNSAEKYTDATLRMVKELEEKTGVKPKIIINLCDRELSGIVLSYEKIAQEMGYQTFKRYKIDGYQDDTSRVLSEEGYGYDDHIPTSKKLILVMGAASNSGKMSTCLGQIYLDKQKGETSGYAKYETFPIWSLPIGHPVNLAYEAATADIGDYNVIDTYHEIAYGKRSVNYNRDVEAFEIIKKMTESFLEPSNYMSSYRSPTDMGINYAGNAISNDQVVCVASLEEIRRRRGWYMEIFNRSEGDKDWIKKCENLEIQALKYIREKGYNPEYRLLK